jgi:hypothetical protein
LKPLFAILFFICIVCISCKKNNTTTDTTPKIRFDEDGQIFQYSGYPSTVQWVGVAGWGSPYNDTSYRYYITAGKNGNNYIILTFLAPHPLSQSNVDKFYGIGIGYGINNGKFGCAGNCFMTLTSSANNLFSGTFSGGVVDSSGFELKINYGTFENIAITY